MTDYQASKVLMKERMIIAQYAMHTFVVIITIMASKSIAVHVILRSRSPRFKHTWITVMMPPSSRWPKFREVPRIQENSRPAEKRKERLKTQDKEARNVAEERGKCRS